MIILIWFVGYNGISNYINVLELYVLGKDNIYFMYFKIFSDEYNSYGIYEKNMDDLLDDFRNYEVCRVYDKFFNVFVLWVFLFKVVVVCFDRSS